MLTVNPGFYRFVPVEGHPVKSCFSESENRYDDPVGGLAVTHEPDRVFYLARSPGYTLALKVIGSGQGLC